MHQDIKKKTYNTSQCHNKHRYNNIALGITLSPHFVKVTKVDLERFEDIGSYLCWVVHLKDVPTSSWWNQFVMHSMTMSRVFVLPGLAGGRQRVGGWAHRQAESLVRLIVF